MLPSEIIKDSKTLPKVLGCVIVPNASGRYIDTREGGTEFWLIIRRVLDFSKTYAAQKRSMGVRGICITSFHPGIDVYDVVVPREFALWLERPAKRTIGKRSDPKRRLVECAICIGATTLTLWDEEAEKYWEPSKADLTSDGQSLFDIIAKLYNQEPSIVVAIGT